MLIFLTLGGVAQKLSGKHTHSGPVSEQRHLCLYPDMLHYMARSADNSEIGLRN